MDRDWDDKTPIYLQLRDIVVEMILDGILKEGDPLPTVRNVAAEFRVNPLTVLKGYQELVNDGLVETRRGRGMFVNQGTRATLLQSEREKFMNQEWPRIRIMMDRLGIEPTELLRAEAGAPSDDSDSKPPKTDGPDNSEKEG